MRTLLLVTCCAVATLPLNAQLLYRCTQISYGNGYNTITRWNDSLWAFAGNIDLLGSDFTIGYLRIVDTTGTDRWSLTPQVPFGSEITDVLALAPRTGDTLILAGLARETCSGISQHGFLTAYDPEGDSLWTVLIGQQAITALACPSGMILCARGDELLVLDAEGDSITSVTSPFGAIRRMRTHGDRALVVADDGVMVLDSVAQLVASRSFLSPNSALDIAAYTDSGFAIATTTMAYRTGPNLGLVDSVAFMPVGDPVALGVDLGYLWVIGSDTARFFDTMLQQVLRFPMKAANGYQPANFMVGSDVIMSAGEFKTGPSVSSAVMRSVDKHGDVPPEVAEVSLSNLDLFEAILDPWPGLTGSYSAQVTVRTDLYNYSSFDLTSATLNYFSANNPLLCNLSGISETTGGWTLSPGSFVQVLLDGIVDSVSLSEPFVQLCLRVSTPNGIYMDANTANDEVCSIFELPVGITDHARGTWHVAPNPATDHLMIRSAVALSPGLSYRIVDPSGREAAQGSIQEGRVPVRTLPPGSYLLWLEGFTSAVRFVKM